ncbi:hypothetical protein [Micromonospora sp. NPDC005161]
MPAFLRSSMTLDLYAGLFGDDLDAVANRLDEAVTARDKDYSRTGTVDASRRACCVAGVGAPAERRTRAQAAARAARFGPP